MSYKYEDFLHDYDDDEDYIGLEDELAFVHSLDRAFAGDTEYMRVLADVYSSNGHGVKLDYNKAIFWLEKLVECGKIFAAVRLGDMYLEYDKEGVPNDFDKSFEYYKIAAKKGNAKAIARLGVMFLYGIGPEKDCGLARELLERAAEEGDGEGCYYFARILKEEGADDWFDYLKRAAEKSNGKACWELAKYFAATLTDNRFLISLACAASYYSFDFDPTYAQLRLADCFMVGYRMRKSASSAKSYYKMAAEGGSQEAKEKLKKYFNIES